MSWFARGSRSASQGSRDSRRSSPGRVARGSRLRVEHLEDRIQPSILFVEPFSYPVDGAHFHSLQDALGAAANGDTIQVEPGALIQSVGSTTGNPTGASTLAAASKAGDTTILAANFVAPGEVISIGSGANTDSDLVLAASPAAGGRFNLTLKGPLANPHVQGDRIDTTGQFGIGKSLTLQGGSVGANAAVFTPLVIWAGTSGVTLQTLSLGLVTLQNGSSGTTIRNANLEALTEAGTGGGNGRNTLREDTISGPVSLTGNPNGTTTGDQILNNQFQDGTLTLTHDDGAVVRNNVFNDRGSLTAVTVLDSQNVLVSANRITIVAGATSAGGTGGSGPVAIAVAQNAAPAVPVAVTLLNNFLNTGGVGRGLVISPALGSGSNLRALLQGNDFHFNQIGIEDQGDGTAGTNAAGIIDAGGGVLGSLGGNNFRGFQSGDASSGTRFALYLHGTTGAAGTISVVNNLFSVSSPAQVVKDSANNTAAGSPPLAAGTGVINTGTTAQQLSADLMFVQSLYNQFLGRSGAVPELNTWVAQLPTMGQTGVANAIIHTPEGLARLVDSYYLKYLNRPADSMGEAFWVNALQNGMTPEQVIAGFASSSEYYDRLRATATAPDAAYVQSLYNVLLGRTGSNSEVTFWLGQLAAHNGDRRFVALGFSQSAEYRGDVVTGYYYNLLHRTTAPSSAEIASWVNSSLDLLGIAAGFGGSGEFYVVG